MSRFIITFTPYFKKSAIRELCKINRGVTIEKMLGNSIAIIKTDSDMKDFMKGVAELSPIFIKHMMPVMEQGKIIGNLAEDTSLIKESVEKVANIENGDRFAVQCRIISGGHQGLEYSSKDMEVFIGRNYERQGGIPTFNDHKIQNETIDIISILINEEDYYIGFSTSKENLNFSCDEYRLFSREGREISRAENKLKEALSKFGIVLDGKGIALDIGAAPGGWTKVLADYGYEVIAVDPGDLHPDLQDHPKITHYKSRIESLNFENYFDIIVNDMNVDPQITAQIMNSLSPMLKENGLCIVTFKLPNKLKSAINKEVRLTNVESVIAETASILSMDYDVLDIKSLFHNRQEVTALIRKKALIKEPDRDIKTR